MIYLISSTILFGVTLFFIKISTSKISPLMGNVIFGCGALFVQFVIILFLKLRGTHFALTGQGVRISILGGIFLGIYTVLLFFTFSKFGISKATPIVYIGAITISSLLGVIFLGEKVSTINIAGFVLAFAGLALLFVR